MNTIEEKTNQSISVILDAMKKHKGKKPAIFWTGGKDSTVMLHIMRSIAPSYMSIPTLFADHGQHFEETYQFIAKIQRDWRLQLHILTDEKVLKDLKILKKPEERKRAIWESKIRMIQEAAEQWDMFFIGVRWDEHEARSHEKYITKKNHQIRIHPILHFTESDIWEYIHKHNLPYLSLYDQGYRSIDEKEFTKKVAPGGSERSGREQGKEEIMKQLRKIGYF